MHQCYLCGLIYSHRQNLNRHMSNVHNQKNCAAKFDCCLCGQIYTKKKDVLYHFTATHQISIVTEEYNFQSVEQFTGWKAEYEKKNAVRYILKCGSKLKTVGKIYYSCHRSGHYQSKGKGNRHLKTQGSLKIGGYCPSGMILTRKGDGSCKLIFVTTHVGHKNELAHLRLTESERRAIAAKIADRVPFNAILEEVRDSLSSPAEVERIHLLTRKDLHNIGKCFNLTPNFENDSGGDTVDTWVRDRLCSPNNCILLYKAQGETSDDFPCLSNEDFALGIMNSVQENMLRSNGKGTVCIDTTPKASFFAMTAISVTDNEGGAYPCAFLFSSRNNKEVLKLFFQSIKSRVGNVSTKALQTDQSDTTYAAWQDVMGKPLRREFSSWAVQEAWQRKVTKIRPPEKRRQALRLVLSLLRHKDRGSFYAQLQEGMDSLVEDHDTTAFGCLFREQFLGNVEQWALCLRTERSLRGNKGLEEMHRRLEQIYTQAKRTNRLDRAIHGAMRLLTERVVGKDKKTAKVDRQRREPAAEETKEVPAPPLPSSSNVFTVSLDQEPCSVEADCATRKVCIHRYRCTCSEWAKNNSICKHIQIVSQLAAKAEQNTVVQRTEVPPTDNCEGQEMAVESEMEEENKEREEEEGDQQEQEEPEVEEIEEIEELEELEELEEQGEQVKQEEGEVEEQEEPEEVEEVEEVEEIEEIEELEEQEEQEGQEGEEEEGEEGYLSETYHTESQTEVKEGDDSITRRRARLKFQIEVLSRAIDESQSEEELGALERILAPVASALLGSEVATEERP